MKKNILIIVVCFLAFLNAFTQDLKNLSLLQPEIEYDNIHVIKLDSDTNKSSFVIWIKKDVKAHKHLYHTETILILEGKAEMLIDNKKIMVQKNDYFTIYPNIVHSVTNVLSNEPLKVLSIQAPEFFNKDRVFVK